MSRALRIVSLISSATEILYLLGLGKQVLAVSHECDYPDLMRAKPRLTRSLVDAAAAGRAIDDQVRTMAAAGSALYAIDVERLAALAPDLIITQAQCDVCAVRYEDVVSAVQQSPSLAGSKIMALNPRCLDDVLDDIRRIGQATDREDLANRVVRGLRSRADALRIKTAGLAPCERPRVACLEWVDPPMLGANWTPELIEMAGGRCDLVVAGQHSTYADWSAVVAYDPEVVVIMPCGFDLPRAVDEAQPLVGFEGWHDLAAVRGGRVYAVDGNAYFNRSGPRLIDSGEILAHLFHPELFAAPSGAAGSWQRLQSQTKSLVAC